MPKEENTQRNFKTKSEHSSPRKPHTSRNKRFQFIDSPLDPHPKKSSVSQQCEIRHTKSNI